MKIKRVQIIPALVLSSFLFSAACSGQPEKNTADTPLQLITHIPLPGINGRIDHLAYNSKGQIIYVAALGSNAVVAVDLKSKKVIHTITGLSEPQGIRYIPEKDAIVVANGGDGECHVYNAGTYNHVALIKLGDDADNVRYNASAHRIYVGYGDGAVAVIDATDFKLLSEIKLPGHPESFQSDNKGRIFVNVPDAHQINVIETEKNSITEKWKLEETSNFPMAIDTVNNRLFIGCRHPAKLLVLNTETGKKLASLDIDNDTDDVFYDYSARQVYVSCGGGSVVVIGQTDPDRYKNITKLETRSGARTALFVPELKLLIVAAPARSGLEAQLMIYGKK